MKMMKKSSLAFLIILISTFTYFTALAGTWTKVDSDGYEYSQAMSYIKNDGTYAREEWVQDTDGTYYWIEYDGALPVGAGISTDGYMYDDIGRYIDFTDGSRKYLDPDVIPAFQAGTTYDQVVSLLGQPHSTVDYYRYYYSSYYGYGDDTITASWYTQDMNSYLNVIFYENQIYSVQYHATFN